MDQCRRTGGPGRAPRTSLGAGRVRWGAACRRWAPRHRCPRDVPGEQFRRRRHRLRRVQEGHRRGRATGGWRNPTRRKGFDCRDFGVRPACVVPVAPCGRRSRGRRADGRTGRGEGRNRAAVACVQLAGPGVRRRVLDARTVDAALGAGLDRARGPGIGLIVAWIAVILLTFHWARVVWSRTAVQLAAEEARRRTAAERQSKTLLESLDDEERKEDEG